LAAVFAAALGAVVFAADFLAADVRAGAAVRVFEVEPAIRNIQVQGCSERELECSQVQSTDGHQSRAI